MNGASTNPDFNVLTKAAVQVKNAMEATIALGGTNYVFWGGREGYMSLHNTDTKRELGHMGKFLATARDYARKLGFKGTFLIEPKPMEPMKHQYDCDTQTVIGFLRAHGLENDFRLNIEVNHAKLAGHTFAHELRTARDNGMLVRSTRTKVITKTDGIRMNSQPIFMRLRRRCWKLFKPEDSPPRNYFDAKPSKFSRYGRYFMAHIGGMDVLPAHWLLPINC